MKKAKKVVVPCKHLLPVEQVVSGHHAQEACWISDWVELVVELFKLLVQQISRLALCLAAWTPSGRETGRHTDGVGKTESKVDFYCSFCRLIKCTTIWSVRNTNTFSHTHWASFCRLGPTLWINSFHFSACDSDPVNGESTSNPFPSIRAWTAHLTSTTMERIRMSASTHRSWERNCIMGSLILSFSH